MKKANEQFPPLNLPAAGLQIRPAGERHEVFDRWRGRWVTLTPEEWVRQHFASMLVAVKGYPGCRLANEVSLTLNSTSRRCDTVVYDLQMRPLMIVEYKAPHIAVTQRVFDQIVRYNMVLRAPYLVVSNGMSHYCCRVDAESRSYQFLPDVPDYQSIK